MVLSFILRVVIFILEGFVLHRTSFFVLDFLNLQVDLLFEVALRIIIIFEDYLEGSYPLFTAEGFYPLFVHL